MMTKVAVVPNTGFRPAFILHAILLAVFPILSLANTNVSEIPIDRAARALVFVLVLATIVLFFSQALFRNWEKAGVATSLLLIFVMWFGQVYELLRNWEFGAALLGRYRFLLPTWSLVFLALLAWVFFQKSSVARKLVGGLNVFAIVLVLLPAFSLIRHFVGASPSRAVSTGETPAQQSGSAFQEREPPDIYYIVLDAYGRQDVLDEIYRYDNAGFIRQLTQLGFYIPEASYANYNQTMLSLASSMNMSYVQDLFPEVSNSSRDRGLLENAVADSRVLAELRRFGYQFAAFNSGYLHTQIRDADRYLTLPNRERNSASGAWRINFLGGQLSLNNFEVLLLQTSIARPLFGQDQLDLGLFSPIVFSEELQALRENTEFAFENLGSLAANPGHFFVLAHILSPHPPFYVGPNGELLENVETCALCDGSHFEGSVEEYISGYANKLEYTNSLLLQAVEEILSRSSTPPIIIIQGDHGPGSQLNWNSAERSNLEERFGIFTAIYLPDGPDNGMLYPTISPVNLFPVILDSYFGYDLELLPDRSFYAPWDEPFRFIEVTDELRRP